MNVIQVRIELVGDRMSVRANELGEYVDDDGSVKTAPATDAAEKKVGEALTESMRFVANSYNKNRQRLPS